MSFYCTLCDKTFKKRTESGKTDHSRIHLTGPCKCQIYDVSLNFQSAPVFHTKKGRIPAVLFQCGFCGKTFQKKYFVQSHIMCVHENVKIKCGRCANVRYTEDLGNVP